MNSNSTLRQTGATLLLAFAMLWTGLAAAADRGAWAANVSYATGDIASYGGKGYDCRQGHTSLTGWEPPNVPALWQERSGSTPSDTTAPSTPSGLTSTAKTSSSVSLSWSASTDNVGVTGYEVFSGSTLVASPSTPSATVSGLSANTTYTFTVKARDAAGNRSSASSAYSTTTSPASSSDTQAPSTPSSLTSTAKSSSSVSLSWTGSTDNVGVTGYEVFVNGSSSASTSSTSTSATVSGLSANTTYTFAVKARDAAGNRSTSSNSISVTTSTSTPPSTTGKVIVGYWHNFDNGSTNIRLRDISPKYNVIQVAFAEPSGGAATGNMTFAPYNATTADFKADIAYLKSQGKKVLISIGGANGTIHLDNATAKATFVSSMQSIIDTYGFDGLDLDLEGSSLSLDGGDTDFRSPTTAKIINLIDGTRQLINRYGSGFMLTMAPETAYVQGGYSAYGGPWGAYLPVIYALRDRLTYLHVQHYNTGTVTGLDGKAYAQGTPDFHVAMAEMMLQGFPVGGNSSRVFPALNPSQVIIGLPSSPQAAGGGYTTPANVQKALDYLIKGKSFGGSYTLRKSGGYPDFKGVMTWSINWDKYTNNEFSNSHRAYLDSL